jgi:ParB family transcriptional regulator, chromosome partitioning protein
MSSKSKKTVTDEPSTVAIAPPPAPAASGEDARYQGVETSDDVADIPLSMIVVDPGQPRKDFGEESIAEMARSLKAHGQLQPIRVRWDASAGDNSAGAWVLISGERRFRAARVAGLATIQCVIERRDLDVKALRVAQLVENIQREDINPVDMARALQSLMDDHDWTQVRLSEELGIERTKVVKALSVINKLPAEVVEMVETGAMPMSTAHELTKLPTDEAKVEVARAVIAEDLSQAETIEKVKEVKARESPAGEGRGVPPSPSRSRKKKPDLERDMVFNRKGMKVHVTSEKGFTLGTLGSVLGEIRQQVDDLAKKAAGS